MLYLVLLKSKLSSKSLDGLNSAGFAKGGVFVSEDIRSAEVGFSLNDIVVLPYNSFNPLAYSKIISFFLLLKRKLFMATISFLMISFIFQSLGLGFVISFSFFFFISDFRLFSLLMKGYKVIDFISARNTADAYSQFCSSVFNKSKS